MKYLARDANLFVILGHVERVLLFELNWEQSDVDAFTLQLIMLSPNEMVNYIENHAVLKDHIAFSKGGEMK